VGLLSAGREGDMNRREFMQHTVLTGAAAAVGSRQAAAAVPPSDRVTLGLIGTGARVHQLIEAAQAIPGVEIVALCDAYTGRASRARERTGGRAVIARDHREILARSDVDAVIVGTPDHLHRNMTVAALEAGKDVYVEKPMTYTVGEGREIIAAVKKTGRMLQAGSQGMSGPIDGKARELVKAGRLGQVTMIRASYNRNTAGGAWIYPIPPDAGPATVDWDAFLGPAPKRPLDLERFFRWRCYWDYSGGIAGDLFVHLLTSIHYVMGATMPSSVVATGELYRWKASREVPDTANAVLVYPEGFTVNLSSTFNNQSSSESGFEILGTEGSIAFRGDRLVFTPERVHEDNRWVVASWPRDLERAYYENPKVQAEESPWTWKPTAVGGSEVWEHQGQDDTVTHLANFIASVRSRQQPNEPAEMGHHAAAGAHMVNMSLRQRRLVEWDYTRDTVKETASSA
jgi:predicted dehydrogenase